MVQFLSFSPSNPGWAPRRLLVLQNSVVLEVDRAVLIQVFLNPDVDVIDPQAQESQPQVMPGRISGHRQSDQ